MVVVALRLRSMKAAVLVEDSRPRREAGPAPSANVGVAAIVGGRQRGIERRMTVETIGGGASTPAISGGKPPPGT